MTKAKKHIIWLVTCRGFFHVFSCGVVMVYFETMWDCKVHTILYQRNGSHITSTRLLDCSLMKHFLNLCKRRPLFWLVAMTLRNDFDQLSTGNSVSGWPEWHETMDTHHDKQWIVLLHIKACHIHSWRHPKGCATLNHFSAGSILQEGVPP